MFGILYMYCRVAFPLKIMLVRRQLLTALFLFRLSSEGLWWP